MKKFVSKKVVDIKSYSLTDIIDIDILQSLQDSFARSNNVASSITDPNGIPITKPSNHSGVCTLIRETKIGLQRCIDSGKTLGEISLKSQKPTYHICQSVGFIDAAAPIVIEGVHIANWLIGQNSVGEVDDNRIISYAEEIGADSEKMLNEFHAMVIVSESKFKEKLDFLWQIANQISHQAFQHLKYQTMLESLENSQKELSDYKDNLEKIVSQRTVDLENAIKQIQKISITDALTGCFNRGGIIEYLPKEMKRARRYKSPVTILICDLDHFKKVNDTYGHPSGDIVLKQVVIRMQELIREDVDWLARYGGEEFLLIMPHTTRSEGMKTAERLRQEISELSFVFSDETVRVTASFGVSSIEDWEDEHEITHEDLLNSADVYLYQAKKGGRNMVVSGPPIIDKE
jgi:diguanylate cyclase (GGDEF)-like protein